MREPTADGAGVRGLCGPGPGRGGCGVKGRFAKGHFSKSENALLYFLQLGFRPGKNRSAGQEENDEGCASSSSEEKLGEGGVHVVLQGQPRKG